MTYIALYRRYRSQTFEDVVGQDHVTRTLQNAIKAGRVGHAYLFCGSRGTGKTTVARLLAKAVNCVNGPTAQPCNECEACRSISDGVAVDVVEMDAASHRGVDDVDSLREGVKYPPMTLRYKVYIIDEAHQLTPQAKDAFLKTLEEPPPHAIFVLATTEAHAIPATIRSRCQQFDFRRGSLSDIGGRLKYVCESEDVKIDEGALELLSKNASGSWRDALSLLEQVLAYTGSEVTAKDVSAVLGSVDVEMLFEVGDVLAEKDPARAFELADRMISEGKDVRELLRSITGHFRDVLHASVGLNVGGEYADRFREQASRFTRGQLVTLVETFAAAEKEIRWNDQHRLVLELAMLKASDDSAPAAARPAPAVQPAPTPAPAAKPAPAPQVVRETAPAPVVPEAEPPVEKPVNEETEPAVEKPVSKEAKPPAEKPGGREVKPAVEKPVKAEVRAAAAESKPSTKPETPPESDGGGGADGGVTIEEVRHSWGQVLGKIKSGKDKSVHALLREGRPVSVEGDSLVVGFPSTHRFHKDNIERPQSQQIIIGAIYAVMGKKLRLQIRTVDPADLRNIPSGYNAAPTAPAEEQDPLFMDDVISMFGGEVIEEEQSPWEDQ